MNEKRIALILRLFCVGLGICGIAFYFFALPSIGSEFAQLNPEYSSFRLPWLIFLWCTSIPCFTVLIFIWKLSMSIGKGRAFTIKNSKYFGIISLLTLADASFFLLGNLVFLFLNVNHSGILVCSLFISFLALGFAFCCRVFSLYLKRAAELQEQSDFTI